MSNQAEHEALTLRYIESQSDSGPHKPAMPGHIAVERGIEVVARLPIPDGLAPSHTPRTVTTVEELRLLDPRTAPAFITRRGLVIQTGLFTFTDDQVLELLPATVLALASTPRTVTTVEGLDRLAASTRVVTARNDVTTVRNLRAACAYEPALRALAFPAIVIATAINPTPTD